MNPHTSGEDTLSQSSKESKDATIAEPKVLIDEAPKNASPAIVVMAEEKPTVSGSSMAIASNASYIMSLAILVLSVTVLF